MTTSTTEIKQVPIQTDMTGKLKEGVVLVYSTSQAIKK